MNYNFNEIKFPSSDGKNTVYAEVYTPKHTAPVGVVQIVHGMIDYTGRYERLADFFTSHGYAVAGNHHLGHGKTAESSDDYGYFADKDGYKYVIEDVHLMNKYLRNTFQTLPVFILGHSMGSFISRMYVAKYPHTVRGFIIHGTGGPNPLVGVGKVLARLIKAVRGPKHRSGLIESMAFGAYNSKFPKSEGNNAWLTRDLERVKDRETNEYT